MTGRQVLSSKDRTLAPRAVLAAYLPRTQLVPQWPAQTGLCPERVSEAWEWEVASRAGAARRLHRVLGFRGPVVGLGGACWRSACTLSTCQEFAVACPASEKEAAGVLGEEAGEWLLVGSGPGMSRG